MYGNIGQDARVDLKASRPWQCSEQFCRQGILTMLVRAASDVPIGCSQDRVGEVWMRFPAHTSSTSRRRNFLLKYFPISNSNIFKLIRKKLKSWCKSLYKMTFVSAGYLRQNFFQTFFVVKTELLLTHVSIFMLGCLCFSSNILNWIQIISKIMYLNL